MDILLTVPPIDGLGSSRIFLCGKVDFQSPGKFTAREHDSSPAAFTFKPDIRAQARNDPFIRAARVLFSEAELIVEAEVREHIC